MKGYMQEEGIVKHLSLTEGLEGDILLETLVCFVLIEASTRAHSFCSRYDFGPWPMLTRFSPKHIDSNVSDAFMQTRALLTNGCVFDELSPEVVAFLASTSHGSGATVFFDPGVLFWHPGQKTPNRCVLSPKPCVSMQGERQLGSGIPQPDSLYRLVRWLE
jgi:hypothetical protein